MIRPMYFVMCTALMVSPCLLPRFQRRYAAFPVLLGAAGFLRDKRATTHPAEYDALRPYCAEVVAKRIVDAGNVITAGGVTSAIDVGLYVVERLAGPDVRHKIARQMDYPYALPPDSVVTPRP